MFDGIFPPVPTPFRKDKLAIDELKRNMNFWNTAPVAGIVALGSNGEGPLLSRKEKIELVTACRAVLSADKKLIAGAGSESVQETIELIKALAEAGADTALVVTPFYYKPAMTHEALLKYFSVVADQSPVPILIYNVPKYSGVAIEPRTVAELSKHPNIAGMKHSSDDLAQLAEFIHAAPDKFSVISGSAGVFFAALCLGASGGILAVSNLLPEKCYQIYRDVKDGKTEQARKLQFELLEISRVLTGRYGIGGLKYAMELMGLYGGPPRLPLLPPSLAQQAEIRQFMIQKELIK